MPSSTLSGVVIYSAKPVLSRQLHKEVGMGFPSYHEWSYQKTNGAGGDASADVSRETYYKEALAYKEFRKEMTKDSTLGRLGIPSPSDSGCCLTSLFNVIVIPTRLFSSSGAQDPTLHIHSMKIGVGTIFIGCMSFLLGLATNGEGGGWFIIIGIGLIIMGINLINKYSRWKTMMEERGYVISTIDVGRSTKSSAEIKAEMTVALKGLQVELIKLSDQSNVRMHEKWMKQVDTLKDMTGTLVLVSQQMANNPSYDVYMNEFRLLTTRAKHANPNLESDADWINQALERMAQMAFTKNTGVKLDDI
jgi:hypothetical protein